MTCEQMEALLPTYVDGEASEDEQHWIEEHLDRCPGCVSTLNYLRRADAIVAAWPAVPREMRPELAHIDARVLPQIQRRSRFAPLRLRRVFRAPGLGAVVLVVVAALVGIVSVLPSVWPGNSVPGETRAAQETRIRHVAAEFVSAANGTIQPQGAKSQSGASTVRARSYLSPRYQAGLADFRRAVAGNRTVLRLSSGRTGTERDTKALLLTMVEEDQAAGYVDVMRRGGPVRVRFGFERVEADWKIARLEAARIGGANATPTVVAPR
ncbi:MAG: zf-HC2 domain-containing protein [Chloroflexota bacterium]|nr:zf-HC2 domain-containing protein [Chloroflexota bacterium]